MNKGEATVAILGVEPLWSVREVSAYLNVPECTVYGWRTAGFGRPAVWSVAGCATGGKM